MDQLFSSPDHIPQRLVDYLMLLRQRQDKNDWTVRDIPTEALALLNIFELANKSGILTNRGNLLTSSKLY